MSNIQPFKFGEQPVRIEVDDNGEPWFCGKDVTTVLGYENGREAIRQLDEDEKRSVRISDGTSPAGGNPNFTFISEPGLYALALRSNKPEAKPFQRWVRHEVLPTIRKTGQYVAPGTVAVLPNPESITAAIMKLTEAAREEGRAEFRQLARDVDDQAERAALEAGQAIDIVTNKAEELAKAMLSNVNRWKTVVAETTPYASACRSSSALTPVER